MIKPLRSFRKTICAIACVILATGCVVPQAPVRRAIVGYYPSWQCGSPAMPDCHPAADLSQVPSAYTHVVLSFAKPDFAWDGRSWAGSGLQFLAGPTEIKNAVEALHRRRIRVLLAVGGASYVDWAPLAAENGSDGPITRSLAEAVSYLGLDGLDVDYEKNSTAPDVIAEYAGAIRAMHRAVRLAGRDKILTLAAWSTGADCTPDTGLAPCGGRASLWQKYAGRERLLFRDKALPGRLSMISVMTYDTGTEHFDAVAAWSNYRDLVPSRVVVNMGFEIAPEGWGNGRLVADSADAVCPGSVVAADQFGNKIGQPYSLERLIRSGPLSSNTNPRDGAMLWNILKDQDLPHCGDATVVSPREWEAKARALLDGQ